MKECLVSWRKLFYHNLALCDKPLLDEKKTDGKCTCQDVSSAQRQSLYKSDFVSVFLSKITEYSLKKESVSIVSI